MFPRQKTDLELLTRPLVIFAVRSEGGADCRQTTEAVAIAARVSPLNEEDWENKSNATDRSGRGTPI